MTDPYAKFLASKAQSGDSDGFEPLWMPDFLFGFQAMLTEWAVRQGRSALLVDCGMGKSPLALTWAQNVYKHTGKPVLLLTPLGVTFQMVTEAGKFGVDAAISRDGMIPAPVTITNYEQLEKFDRDQFGGVVCDECFVGDTPVDTPTGPRPIEDIRPGDQVLNAAGTDTVVAVKEQVADRVVVVHVDGHGGAICSENHPWLTPRGWVCAADLAEGESLVEQPTALRVVRSGYLGQGEPEDAVLWSILCRDMAGQPAGRPGEPGGERSAAEASAELRVVRDDIPRWSRRDLPGFARVDRVEILESGDPRLAAYRAPNGQVRLFDIQLAAHPSFSVNGLLVHNSSCIKAFAGVRRAMVTEFLRTMPYRLLCSATAAPNDYVELGTSSEALGYLGHMDMLARFFTNKDKTSKAFGGRWRSSAAEQWRFKGHAEEAFWRWVSSWARAARKPSDLGFDDDGFVLPPLETRRHVVEARTLAEGTLFDVPANGLQEEREETRRTITERCEKAAELLADAQPGIAWCQLNDEGDLLTKLIDGAVQVSGSDSPEVKEERLAAFARGEIRVLVTKPKIASWGLNYQNCHRMTYMPSHSFEQMYQAVRRCWRFGQPEPVIVDVVTTTGGEKVLANLERKAAQADAMFSALTAHMRDAQTVQRTTTYDKQAEVPSWVTS